MGSITGGLVLCADDFALTDGVSRAILDLLTTERLNATGVMSNRPGWPAWARELAPFAEKAEIGLHLNLTCAAPLTRMESFAPAGQFPALRKILQAGMLGRLPRAEIAAEIEAQLDAFETASGFAPAFVDGHQHVHAMPGIRDALLEVLGRRYRTAKPWLRDPADALPAILARRVQWPKALLVARLAGAFGRQARAAGFATNIGFSGFSAFDPRRDYAADFSRYLIGTGPRHLVMCHPGHVDRALLALDPATESRARELAFFASSRFLEILAARGQRLVRFNQFFA